MVLQCSVQVASLQKSPDFLLHFRTDVFGFALVATVAENTFHGAGSHVNQRGKVDEMAVFPVADRIVQAWPAIMTFVMDAHNLTGFPHDEFGGGLFVEAVATPDSVEVVDFPDGEIFQTLNFPEPKSVQKGNHTFWKVNGGSTACG